MHQRKGKLSNKFTEKYEEYGPGLCPVQRAEGWILPPERAQEQLDLDLILDQYPEIFFLCRICDSGIKIGTTEGLAALGLVADCVMEYRI